MKLLLTTIAAVLVMGCGTTQPTEPPTAKAPDVSIHDAAQDGNIEAVKQHLAAGTDVNLGGGATPLHPATYSGHKEIVELLIANGANVNTKAKGWTPLDKAEGETADLLRKHGGKISEVIQESLLIFDRNSNILSAAN